MNKIVLIISVLLIAKTTFAQQNNSSNTDSIYNFVSQKPQFPGGDSALANFLNSNLHYPSAAQKQKAEGTDVARFVVNKDGSVSDIEVLRDIGFGCKDQVIKTLQQMPKWIPGEQNGNIVRAYYYLPVNFKINHVDMPQFPGGQSALTHFMVDNLRYPPNAKANNVQGFEIVKFLIDTNGIIRNPVFVQTLDDACDSEALRVISAMPRWTPAKVNGKPVKMYFTLPISFHLSGGAGSNVTPVKN